jgi:hypothetical protein
MGSIDLFEQIKIAGMDDAEKIALMDHGPEYLKILSKDAVMGIRLRAKKRIRELATDEEAQREFADEVEYLREQAQSNEFGVRVKAKIILDRLAVTGRI